jgi:hypothetical protein
MRTKSCVSDDDDDDDNDDDDDDDDGDDHDKRSLTPAWTPASTSGHSL